MSSTDRFNEERERYKQMFQQKLIETLTVKEIQYMVKKFDISQYQFMVAQPRHFNAVKHLMIEQYMKTNPIQIVFDSTFELPMITSVTAKLDAGRCIVAVDKGSDISVHPMYIYDNNASCPVSNYLCMRILM